jgi:Fe-S cluster assembly ATPase SufC
MIALQCDHESDLLSTRLQRIDRQITDDLMQTIAIAENHCALLALTSHLNIPCILTAADGFDHFFDHFREVTEGQMAILISHRFSTVRMADEIVVLERGQIVERGTHEVLMTLDGQYAHLFNLQAAGYL